MRGAGVAPTARGRFAPATVSQPTWDVLVVGGGVVGWSVAHHLARAGVRRILVVDRGGGGAERGTGGVRGRGCGRGERAAVAPLARQAARLPGRDRRRSGLPPRGLSVPRGNRGAEAAARGRARGPARVRVCGRGTGGRRGRAAPRPLHP